MLALARLLCATVVLALLAGCGGGSSAEVDATAPELVEEAAEALSEAESYRARFDGTVGITGGQQLTGGLVGENQPVSGEARVSGGDAAIDLAADLGITNLQLTLTRTGNGVWLGLLNQDYTLDLPRETLDVLQPRQIAPALVGWISEPELTGTDSIGGTDVALVNGSVDPDAILADLSAVGGGAVDDAAADQLRDALTEGEITLAIGIEDRLPRRVGANIVLEGQVDVIDAQGASLDIDLQLSDFGEPVPIPEPENAIPFSFDDLGAVAP